MMLLCGLTFGMLIIKPYIFKRFPEIIFGFSTMTGNNNADANKFNMSFNVGDDRELVSKNRSTFFKELGLNSENITYQKQVHGDGIKFISEGGNCGESDAMITSKPGLGLAISSADCTAIFIYDTKNKIIAAVHSGWRGTSKKILEKTLSRLIKEYKCNPEDMICYLSPSISQINYEIGQEVAEYFDDKYLIPKNGKFLLDVSSSNYDMLIKHGVNTNNIQKSKLCSYGYKTLLHSYRRDGEKSGRALGIISIRNSE